jgi:hypothetical protein
MVSLLAGRLGSDGYSATLLDLAARGWFRLETRPGGPAMCTLGYNPLSAHRERRRREADASGQRAEETGGQPVTFGITRASELIRARVEF